MYVSMIPILIVSVDFYTNCLELFSYGWPFPTHYIQMYWTIFNRAHWTCYIHCCFYMAQIYFDPNVFRCPILSKAENLNGFRLVIDTCSDTAYKGEHTFVK